MKISNIQELDNLTEDEREYAVKILKEISEQGKSESYDKLLHSDYKEIPVSIEEFIDNEIYLGKALKNEKGESTVYPYWREVLKEIFPTPYKTSYQTAIFTGGIGLGKAQPLYSKILTTDGYKSMGELSFTDRVYGDDGKPHNIIGIFPQGKKKVYEITFSDGAKTRCCNEHLWNVQKVTKGKSDKWQTVSLSEILTSKNNCNSYIYRIPTTTPIKYEEKTHIVEPYVFGVNMCKSVIESIPTEYLYDCVENRIALLQGLMDTNGYISKSVDTLQYYSRSEKLCNNVAWLVRSLGGVAKINIKQENHKENDMFCKSEYCYAVSIILPKDIIPFRLSQKLEVYNAETNEPSRYIEDIVYIGEEECQCIMINSESHLYITDDFIVTHNSTIADIGLAYMIYRVMCLRDAYAFFGLQRVDTISFVFLNNTIDNAKDVAWKKLHSMLLLSEWFCTHGSVNNAKREPEWTPPEGIDLVAGSSANHMIGRCVLGVFVDEANFSATSTDIEKQKAKMLDLVTSASIRMQSRFMKGEYNPSVLFIASSKKDEQSFMETFIASKKKNESRTTLIIDEPQWVIRTDKDSPIKFKVALGNKFLSNELLPINITQEETKSYVDRGYTIIEVPIGYYEQFQDDLDKALMEIAGISTSGITKYLSGQRVAKVKTDTYKNAFTKDIIEVGNAHDDLTQYYDYFDMSRIDNEMLYKPLYIHLDMSISGDKTGICGVWVAGKRPHKDGVPDSKELYYKVAFVVSVKAPKGYQISFEKTRQFIYWLRERGFNIKLITSDTFQNADLAQQLQSKGFEYKILSVDRVNAGSKQCEPYHYLKSTIYEERISIFDDCNLLTEELLNLERNANGKVDHPNNGSKDSADALCGSVYAASQYAEQYAYEFGEDIDIMLNVTQKESGEDFVKSQINVDFQEELKKVFNSKLEQNIQNQNENIDKKIMNDIMDTEYLNQGIIIW